MNNKVEWLGTCVGAIMTITQSVPTLQYIQLIFTLISTIVATAYTIYKWYTKAKADGKIDLDEVKELVDITKDAANNITSQIENVKETNDDETR